MQAGQPDRYRGRRRGMMIVNIRDLAWALDCRDDVPYSI